MFNTQRCTTLGLLCDARHPALRLFPTDMHSDWQWEDIAVNSRALVMDSLPRTLRPIVQWIDDWNTNRKLGLIFECRVGEGRLLICTADLEGNLERRPAARQLRASLLTYAAGPEFNPAVEVPADDIRRLFQPAKLSNMVKLNARVSSVDSEDRQNGNVASNAIDGDPDTFWHTRWQPANDPMPHKLAIDLGRPVPLRGITYLPRQDQSNGRIADCEVRVSAESQFDGPPAASAKWADTDQLQTLLFPEPVQARHLQFLIKSEVNSHPFASLAELDVLPAEP
jgi:hypothetical protein